MLRLECESSAINSQRLSSYGSRSLYSWEVEFKDRLTRFGFDYLKRYFESHGVKVEVVEETERGYMEELIEDFVAIVLSFAGRIYGKRSQKFRKIKKGRGRGSKR